MHRIYLILILLGLLTDLLAGSDMAALAATSAAFTVSGTLRGPDGRPVPGVWIAVSSAYKWSEGTTDSNGFYNLQAIGPTWLRFYIKPPVATRLASRSVYRKGPFDSNTTQDFTLVAGHLFSGEFQSPDGTSVYLPWGPEVVALTNPPPADESFFLWTHWRNGTFETVLPPDVYSILVRDPPRPFYPTRITVDLRTTDIANSDLMLNIAPDPLPGIQPPDATRITLSAPDADGYLSVTGAPGAATPFASIVIVHMTSGRWTRTVAGADGSFSATAYGPPGAFLIVKQDPTSRYVNAFLAYATPDPTYAHPIGSANLDPLASAIILVPSANVERSTFNVQRSMPFTGSGIINPYDGVAMWTATGEIVAETTLGRVLSGTVNGVVQPGLYSGGIHWSKPVLADLYATGTPDLYIGEDNGHIFRYRNGGLTAQASANLRLYDPVGQDAIASTSSAQALSYTLPQWNFVTDHWENMNISWWVSPAFVDIDHDGDLDLLAGTGNGRITFFRNIGTPAAPAWRYVTDRYADIDVGDNAVPAFADIDGDSDYDLFIGNAAGRITFYRNIGTREEAIWMFVTSDYLGTSVGWLALPALADIDGDGDLDFFVGSYSKMSYWRNDGTPTTPDWTLVTHRYAGIYEPNGGLAPAFADLDLDGDLDMILGWEFGPVRTYTNFGTRHDPVWARTVEDTLPLDFGGYSTPALGDWDGDGDLDLLVGDYHSRVHVWRNDGMQQPGDGSPAWTDLGLVDAVKPDDLYHAAPALVDIDSDGDLDLFVGEDDGTIDFYRNLGTRTTPDWVLAAADYQSFDVGTHAKPAFGDLDGDADYDLVVGAKDGRLHLYRNIGTPASPAWAAPDHFFGSIDVGNYSVPIPVDLDGDGDLDFLIGDENGRLWAYRNDGGTWTLLTQQYGAAQPDNNAAPALGDLNGDGRPDLVVGSLAGGLLLYLNRGGEPSAQGLQPGDALIAAGTLRVTSNGLPAGFDPTTVYLGGSLELRPFFDTAGRPHSLDSQFRSTFLTPSGFPVERYTSWYNRWGAYFEMTGKRLVNDHTLEADFKVTLRLPDDLRPGWYAPTLEFSFGHIPGATDEAVAGIFTANRSNNLAYGPMVKVGEPATPHLPWMLLADTFAKATRGTAPVDHPPASDGTGGFQLANRRTFQTDTFYIPRSDPRSGVPYTYRLEPFLPFISVGDHGLPNAPLIPFKLPSGQLHVIVRQPDGTVRDLGTAPFVQATSRTPVMLNGDHSEGCSGSVGDIYQLITHSGQFDYQFSQYGQHLITMTGTIEDIWGNTYTGGGTYQVVVGREMTIDAGAVPGTPFQVGDTLAPTLRLSAAVPADVTVRLRLYRNSDPANVLDQTITGRANRFGYFYPSSLPQAEGTEGGSRFTFDAPGEYRLDVSAIYTDTQGVVWIGSQSWGNVVETPDTRLVGHGRRGIDQSYTRTQWFTRNATGVEGGHLNFPFGSGDIAWATDGDGSAARVTFHDPDGMLAQVLRERAALSYPPLEGPGDLKNRLAMGETPLFSVAAGPSDPAYTLNPMEQWGYTYRIAQRPGISVHQQVTEDATHAPIWRFGNRHGMPLGMGIEGEKTNDFKWQFGGIVLRDLVEGWSRYAIYGSLWVDIPNNDPVGSRVFPPFQGAAGGPSGGPLFTLKGKSIDLFIEPTGVKPGAVLEVGNTFAFAGQVAPPLASRVDVVVTSPGGVIRQIHGRANKIGYFYQPAADFIVNEAGVWTVDVTVTHDGMTSAGPVELPDPVGDVLGTDSGRYHFYVVDPAQPRATVNAPAPGWIQFINDWDIPVITTIIPVPQGWNNALLRYTIAMPGWVLQTGELSPSLGRFRINYDPVNLQKTFPNIDLRRPQSWAPGLSDVVFISFVISGDYNGNTVHQANMVTLQGEQVLVEGYPTDAEARGYGEAEIIAPASPHLHISASACTVGVPEIQTVAGLWHQGAAGDRDGDGDTDVVDVMLVASRWGQDRCTRPPWCRADVSADCSPPPSLSDLMLPQDLEDASYHRDVGRVR